MWAQNAHTHANAASIDNEANTVTGWSGGAVISSDATDAHQGSFSIRAVSTASNGRTLTYTFNAQVGQPYTIRIWAKVGPQVSNPAAPAFAAWSGMTGFSTTLIQGTAWTEYVFNVTASSTSPIIRIYTSNMATSSTAGNTIFIDNVSIRAVDSEPPSAVTTLAASGTTATGTGLTWSASTDNIGVTGYQVFRNGTQVGTTAGTAYTANGLSADTSYAFRVLAADAAGNVSAPGNTVNVTTQGSGTGTVDYTSDNANLATVDWQARNVFAAETLGIGTADTQGYALAVAGDMVAESVKVALQTDWPDFVFEKGYTLPSLYEVERHIREKGHLSGLPSADEVKANGIDLGEMNALLLQKIEELTLYLMQQDKKIRQLEKRGERLGPAQKTLEQRKKE
jgi:hypothetical protein